MQVRQVMTEKVTVVAPDTRIPDVARIMRDEDIGSTPIVENDRLIGMVTDRDIVTRVVAEDSDPAAPGEAVTYTLHVGNSGAAILGTTLRATLPAGTTFVSASDGVTLRFTERSLRAFQLLHVLLHELGHHRDRMTTRSKRKASRGESFAEQYARRHGDRIWSRYIEVFGIE